MNGGVLCIGNASYDIYFPMDGYPREDQKYTVETFLEACGGPASNAAYLLGLWKVPVAFAGCVGDDEYGRRIADEFASVEVNTRCLEIRPGHHTPLSCVLTNAANGSRTILNRRRTDSSMRFHPEWLYSGNDGPAFMLLDSHEHEASLKALKLFPKAVSVLDAGSRRKATEDLAGKVTHLICSESFAEAMTGAGPLTSDANMARCAQQLSAINPRPGCYTLGNRGLVWWDDEGVHYLPAFAVEALDSTAAGDVFHGAFLYALHGGEIFKDALIFSSAAAALSVQNHGGRPSIPGVRAVEAFVETCRSTGTLPAPRLLP